MRSVISVVQRKGGVGKTTIAVSLAGKLQSLGNQVAVVDSDPQQSASCWAEPGRLPFPIHKLPLQAELVVDWSRQIDSILTDFIIIDTAPNEFSLRCAILLSELVLLPCTPSGLDLESTMHAVNFIRGVRSEFRVKMPILLVPNRVDSRTLEGQQILEELHHFGERVGPLLGSRSAFVRAFSAGQTIGDFAPGTYADTEMDALTQVVLQMLHRNSSI